MVKIQKKDFNIEKEIQLIKNQHTNIGAVSLFIGYVRDFNNNMDVNLLEIEVYENMAKKELYKIRENAVRKWNLIDCLIIHRYGKLKVNEFMS